MQRFKKEFRKCEFESWRYRVLHNMASENQKFVYGANGTICQYARWRDEQFVIFKMISICHYTGDKNGIRECMRIVRKNRQLAMLPLSLMEFRL